MHQENFQVCFHVISSCCMYQFLWRAIAFCSPRANGVKRMASLLLTGQAKPTVTSLSLSELSCSSSRPLRSTGSVCFSTRARTAASSVHLLTWSQACSCAGKSRPWLGSRDVLVLQYDLDSCSLHNPGFWCLVWGNDKKVGKLNCWMFSMKTRLAWAGLRVVPMLLRMILTVLMGLILKDSSCRCSLHSLVPGCLGLHGSIRMVATIQFLTTLSRCGLSVFALLKLCRYHQQENIRVLSGYLLYQCCDFIVAGQHGQGEEAVDQWRSCAGGSSSPAKCQAREGQSCPGGYQGEGGGAGEPDSGGCHQQTWSP